MTTITRIRTDWINRYHIQADADASVLDCFVVELPPYGGETGLCIRLRDSMSMDDLLAEALAELARLRAQPWKPLLPSHVLIPFGVITARSFEDVAREHMVNMKVMETEHFQTDERWRAAVERDPILYKGAHDRRVADLCRAWDLLNGAPLHDSPPAPFPPVRHH